MHAHVVDITFYEALCSLVGRVVTERPERENQRGLERSWDRVRRRLTIRMRPFHLKWWLRLRVLVKGCRTVNELNTPTLRLTEKGCANGRMILGGIEDSTGKGTWRYVDAEPGESFDEAESANQPLE